MLINVYGLSVEDIQSYAEAGYKLCWVRGGK